MASDSTPHPPNPRLGPPSGADARPRLDPTGPPPEQAPLASGNTVGRRWGIPALIAWVTLSAFAGALWFAYEQGVRKGMETGFPLVRADDGPVKIRPDDPGGLEVPHQDKRIYERMAGDEAAVEDEARLRPEPERPVDREILIASSVTGGSVAGGSIAGGSVAEGDAAGTTVGTTAAPVPPPPVPPPPVPPEETKRKPAPQASVAPPPRQAVASQAVASGPANRSRLRIQLGSYRSAAEAERAWKRLSAREELLLGDLDPLVARADLGDRGIFHRLQAGPFESVKAAQAACARLKQRKLGCLVVRPAAR